MYFKKKIINLRVQKDFFQRKIFVNFERNCDRINLLSFLALYRVGAMESILSANYNLSIFLAFNSVNKMLVTDFDDKKELHYRWFRTKLPR